MFHRYSSIDNFNISLIDKIDNDYKLCEWIAEEKIHGSNFSFITDGVKVECARRTAILKPDEKFYNYQVIVNKYVKDIVNLFTNIKQTYESLLYIHVYGELFGGIYPELQGLTAVQKGVYYTNDIDFRIFDIMITCQHNNDSQVCSYFSRTELENLSKNTHVKLVPLIAKGNFDDIISCSPELASVLYQDYGLTKVANNFAEGLIIKANTNFTINKFSYRPIFKNKNPKFDEIIFSNIDNENLSEITPYLTKNRFHNVLSKISTESYKKIIENFIDDALKDKSQNCDKNLSKIINRKRLLKSSLANTEYKTWYSEFITNS